MRNATAVLLVCACIVLISVSSIGETNLSEGRGLGIGVRFALAPSFSIFPWPFLGIQITDGIGVGVTGFFLPGVLLASTQIEVRLLDNAAVDGLAFVSGAVVSAQEDTSFSAAIGGALEYSLSNRSALRVSVSLTASLVLAVAASYVFYW